MTTYYLINNIRGLHAMHAGSLVDSTQQNIDQIEASGGVLIPVCPQLDVAARIAQNLVRDGNSELAEGVMSAAVDALQINIYINNPISKLIDLGKPDAVSTTAVHADYDADEEDDEFPGPITSPDVPRSVTVTFDADWDGGDVIIRGSLNGLPKMVVIGETKSETIETDAMFDTITSIEKTKKGTQGSASVGIGSSLLVHEDGVPVVITNTTSILWVSGVSEVPVVNKSHSSVKPAVGNTPNGTRTYVALVNVTPTMP